MITFRFMKKRVRISKGGQISIPAAIRRRWATSTVALDDQDDRVVLEPVPDDPIAAAEGALAEEFRCARPRAASTGGARGRAGRRGAPAPVTPLDAYALIAFLVGGPATPHVRAILREGGKPRRPHSTADPDVLDVANAEKLESVVLPGQV
jgi:bifunctional DNA-binding transcriptional regulator/antitoxin component of YhaV-PrlF toxin-antitoxin module